MIGQS